MYKRVARNMAVKGGSYFRFLNATLTIAAPGHTRQACLIGSGREAPAPEASGKSLAHLVSMLQT